MGFKSWSIRKKLGATVFIAVVPVLVVTVFLSLYVVRKQTFSEALLMVSSELKQSVLELNTFANTAQSDVLFLSELSDVRDLLSAKRRGDASAERRARKHLEPVFASLASQRGIYAQIRVLDRFGMECIRADLIDGRVVLAPEEDFQNKKERYYFTETIGLAPGQYYVSPIDLNRENGVVERPNQAMVRVAVPVLDLAGDGPSGMVIINILANDILCRSSEMPPSEPEGGFRFVANNEGYYLHQSRNPEQEWGGPSNLNTDHGLNRDFPDAAQRVLACGEVPEMFRSGRYWLFCQAANLFQDPSRRLIVGRAMPKAVLMANVRRTGFGFAGLSGLIFLLAGAGAWLIARRISGSIEALTLSADRLRQGDFSSRVDLVGGDDELTTLSRGFNEMAEQIAANREELEHQVTSRTREMDEARRAALSLMQDARLEIAERKKAEGQLLVLSRATEQSPAGIVVTDCRGSIEYVNPRFCEITGYTATEVIGKNPRILNGGRGSPELYESLWKTILAGLDWHGEMVNKRKSGELYWANASISPIRDSRGTLTSFVAVHEDVSEQKRAAQELAQAKAQADAASQAKSEFLANMSHEIRTPMNAIAGMTHLALQTDLTAKQKNYLQQIRRASKNLLSIINDILDFSKIEAGKLSMESVPFTLHQVIDQVIGVLGASAQRKGLEFLINIAPEVPWGLVGDPLRLGQVLTNLGNNAIKFTETGEVVVSARLLNRLPDEVELEFSVSDSGIGLSAEQKGRLFQAFEQADTSTTRKYGGTGLGLVICQRLVEMMRGTIRVESEQGKGCIFVFTVRLGVSAELPGSPCVPDGDLRGMNVLLVDDNLAVRDVIGRMLQAMSFRVSVAAGGIDALDMLRASSAEDPYRLVILDWKLDGMDGVQTSAAIRAGYWLSSQPKIILVTGHSEGESFLENVEGVDGLLMKPLTCSSLFDAIMVAFGKPIAVREDGPDGPAVSRALSSVQGGSVLLVEDNEINQEVAKELLEQAGVTVTLAANGRKAVEAVKENVFDLVLMDIQMPEMDGYEATRMIREWEVSTSRETPLPIIAMTAHAMDGDSKKSEQAGMNDHITKPIDPVMLYKTLQKWIPLKAGAPASAPSAPAALAELPPALKGTGLDLNKGLYHLGGRAALYLDLINRFVANYNGVSGVVRSQLAAGRRDEVLRQIHPLKGLSGSLGAIALQKAVAALDDALRENSHPTQELDAFCLEFDRLHAALHKALESESAPAAPVQKPAGSEEELLEILRTMKEPLENGRPIAFRGSLEQLQARDWGKLLTRPVDLLVRRASKYQFDPALELLNELIDQL